MRQICYEEMSSRVFNIWVRAIFVILVFSFVQCRTHQLNEKADIRDPSIIKPITQMQKTEQEWLTELGAEKYRVLRQCGTEAPFTGKYLYHHAKGIYRCAGCGVELFSSDTKFDSGSGWPSFFDALEKSKIRKVRDTSHGMIRTEIRCAQCDGHLGHVFEDGPKPTGLRYCVNSIALDFSSDSLSEH